MQEKAFQFHPINNRKPSGAVKQGESVTMTIQARKDIYLSRLSLVLMQDNQLDEKTIPCVKIKSKAAPNMSGHVANIAHVATKNITDEGENNQSKPGQISFCQGDKQTCGFIKDEKVDEESFDTYTVTYAANEAGLFWYYFKAEQDEHVFYVIGDDSLFATTSGEITNVWQLSVYERDVATPDWFSGRTMYHIFVDRFCCGNEAISKPRALLHKSWEDTPEYLPVNGKILNNDFFGGNFQGIIQKLNYLKSLGVNIIYLSPIFKAASNHRYDTGDYECVDPMLGTEQDFTQLMKACKENDIAIILDGVFNHTGDDSKYFNKYAYYDSVGAYQSQQSSYRDWYQFDYYPHSYHSWWGIDTLPSVNQHSAAYQEYIAGKDGIAVRWLKKGIAGWRLDVVDELQDKLLDQLCKSIKAYDSNAVILGEVWEDASNKIAYGSRRRYFQGGQLDSVMNYPVRSAIISFITNGDSEVFVQAVNQQLDHYPKHIRDNLMNLLSTHDTVRILTVLGEQNYALSRAQKAVAKLDYDQRQIAKQHLKMASLLQYTVFGVPCVYYGDEAGVEGFEDPFNRRCFPWGKEDEELVRWYRLLGELRTKYNVLKHGDFRFLQTTEHSVIFCRGNQELIVGVNNGSGVISYEVDRKYRNLITNETVASIEIYPYAMGLFALES